MFMPVTDPAISLTQAIEITKTQNRAIKTFPEVASVVAKISARGDVDGPRAGEHDRDDRESEAGGRMATGHDTGEAHRRARRGHHVARGLQHLTQPIINRINMLTTGIRSEVGVKVFGSDLNVLQEARSGHRGDALRRIRGRPTSTGAGDGSAVPGYPGDARPRRGTHHVGAIQASSRPRSVRRNLTADDRGRQRFPVRVRYAPEYRTRAQALGGRPRHGAEWHADPARAARRDPERQRPSMISGEERAAGVTVLLNVRGRDVGSFRRRGAPGDRRDGVASRLVRQWSGQ